jgi:tRNA threonylcarbamoyladenosine biosynthesis protein TsaE
MFTVSTGGQYEVMEKDMYSFAQSVIEYVSTKYNTSGAFFVALKGDLGAGKTSFSKKAGEVLGVTDSITSPTFVIQKIYTTAHPVFTKLVHIDAYRLEEEKELLQLNFEETLRQLNTLVLLEWPEKVPEIAKKADLTLEFKVLNENSRTITIL